MTAVDADGDAVVYRLTRPPGPFVVVPQTGEIVLTENPQVYGALWYVQDVIDLAECG